jgi:hypothetical protein
MKSKLFENILDECGAFYDFVRNELHDAEGVEIYSDEPSGSRFSCFDFEYKGDDMTFPDGRFINPDDRRHGWHCCKITMDDDGLYWESATGKQACICIYAICKVEAKPGVIIVNVAPTDTSDDDGVVYFYKSNH